MMTLPKFINPDPSISTLWEEQTRLQNQANIFIRSTGIMELLSKYGGLSEIGGSYKYGLMVYPDLDVGLISETVDKESFAKLVCELVANRYVRKIATADTVNFVSVHAGLRPKGYWIGLEVPFQSDRWGIDCWVQRSEWASEEPDVYGERLRSLDQSGRDAILQIKYDLIRQGRYGKDVFSGTVYDAVLDADIRSVGDFYEHLDTE